MPGGLVDSYNDSDVITQRKTRLAAIKVWLQNSGRARPAETTPKRATRE